MLAATPRAAAAFELPFEATLSIQFGTIAPLVTQTVTRNANVSLGPDGRIASLQLETIDIATTGAQVFPVPTQYAPIGGLQGTFGAWPTAGQQTFVRQTNDRLGGVVRMLGVVRICLFAPAGCPGTGDVFLPLAHAPAAFSPYTAAIGWGGTWSFLAGPGFSFTVRGAPWTTATVSPGGGMTGMGFARGPALQPGTTAMFGGEMNLVTPLFISSTLNGNPNPDFPGVATLAIRFTGDPPDCANGLDDDADGAIDAESDPGCTSPEDTSEQEATLPCDDGLDDDADGLVDHPADPVCQSQTFERENAKCQDGIDNDGDSNVDFDGGASVNGGVPIASPDAQCVQAWRDREAPSACGFGAEIAGILAAILSMRRRAIDV